MAWVSYYTKKKLAEEKTASNDVLEEDKPENSASKNDMRLDEIIFWWDSILPGWYAQALEQDDVVMASTDKDFPIRNVAKFDSAQEVKEALENEFCCEIRCVRGKPTKAEN